MGWSAREVAVAAGIVFAAAVPIGGAIMMVNYANREQISAELEASGNANSYSNRANMAKEDRCLPLATSARAECEAKEDDAARQARHDEYDLAAQRATAIWTRYMGFAAIFGTAFGMLGIVLVLATFRANKRSADAAQDANRPWLHLDIKPGALTISADQVTVNFSLTATNSGKSPAVHVVAFSRLLILSEDEDFPIYIARDTALAVFKHWEGGMVEFGRTVFPDKPESLDSTAFSENGAVAAARGHAKPPNLYLVVGLRYRFLGQQRCTVEAHSLALLDKELRDLKTQANLNERAYILVDHPNTYIT
ncbi:hypothetical protein LVY65_05040 [Sphingomonas sp. G124]|uniref:Uncharacterized protein n=1 Tax=Sphingomonas cremea TaxID=2904799 RepID=A0A9X1QKL2_9SPHN|nr:hypothetical protein [Sphingomonas cremea]MCF2514431.1 hypothetical protein [Sphingomonas cremea]